MNVVTAIRLLAPYRIAAILRGHGLFKQADALLSDLTPKCAYKYAQEIATYDLATTLQLLDSGELVKLCQAANLKCNTNKRTFLVNQLLSHLNEQGNRRNPSQKTCKKLLKHLGKGKTLQEAAKTVNISLRDAQNWAKSQELLNKSKHSSIKAEVFSKYYELVRTWCLQATKEGISLSDFCVFNNVDLQLFVKVKQSIEPIIVMTSQTRKVPTKLTRMLKNTAAY